MHHLTFKAAKEIFRDSVVIRITFSGHTLRYMEWPQLLAEGAGSVPDAAIRMKDQTFVGLLSAIGHAQGLQGEGRINAL